MYQQCRLWGRRARPSLWVPRNCADGGGRFLSPLKDNDGLRDFLSRQSIMQQEKELEENETVHFHTPHKKTYCFLSFTSCILGHERAV